MRVYRVDGYTIGYDFYGVQISGDVSWARSLALYLPNARPTHERVGSVERYRLHKSIVASLLLTGIGVFPFAARHFFHAYLQEIRFTN